MTRIAKLLAIFLVATSLPGCIIIGGEHGWDSGDWKDEQNRNRELISQLEIGEQRLEVMDRLGSPNFSEAYTRDDDEYRVLFYRTQRRHSDGDTTKDETTPLIFRNNILIGWGQEVYASVK
jgi:outer membrane protein assembly factor BamE (lipoprotein component of BamABCDE complex)